MKLKWLSGVACLVLGTATVYGQTVQNNDLKPTGKGWGERDAHVSSHAKPIGGARTNGISYHGGPVMTSGPDVYYIWYGWGGSFADATAESILTNLASTEGGSPYFNINSTYYNGSGTHVTNAVHYKGSTVDNYSQGKSLSDASIQTIVKNALPSLGVDTNAVYFVLTSADVN
jgi:hypothetical protein